MGITSFNATNENYSILDLIESPELTLKDVTLKEAVFKALEKVDAIPRLKYVNNKLELGLDYTNKLKALIASESTFIDEMRQQNVNYYATEMESELLNATNLSDSDEAVEIFPAKGLYISSRSSDFIYNLLNGYVLLPKRINYINKAYIKPKVTVITGTSFDYYVSNNKTIYVDTFTSLPDPTVAIVSLRYITIDTQEIYVSNGVNWALQAPLPSSVTPKVRFVDTFSNFASTDYSGSPVRENDFYIAQDTGKAYIYRSGAYQEISFMDKYGDIVIDAIDRIYEFQRYKTFDVEGLLNANERYDMNNLLQSNTLYYKYRENKLFIGNVTGLFDTTATINVIVDALLFDTLYNENLYDPAETFSSISTTYTDAEKFEFQIHYTPIPVAIRASVDREDVTDVDRYSTILNNQGQRIIELSNIMDNMGGKINKIGNSELQVEHRVKSTSALFEVGDYTSEGYVVTNRELIFFPDYIYAKYDLTRNYNRLNQLIAVNSEVRQYEMGEQNTLQRKLMFSEYVEVDVYDSSGAVPNGTNTSRLIRDVGRKTYLSTFDVNTTYPPVRSGAITTDEITDYLLVGFSSNGGGNTLIFEMQLPGNKSAGETLESSSNWGSSARLCTLYR